MDTIIATKIQAVETAASALSTRAHLLDLACGGLCCGGLCKEGLEEKAELSYVDVKPVHTLAKEVTSLADDLEQEATGLRLKITAPRVQPAA